MHKRLGTIINDLGLTQKDFADRLGINQSTVSRWTSGEKAIPKRTIQHLCKEFSINKDWLLYGIGSMKKEKTYGEILSDVGCALFETFSREEQFAALRAIRHWVSTGEYKTEWSADEEFSENAVQRLINTPDCSFC